ncbi:hypothetical protein LJC52_04710, partial [Bacteroidales bacterium OttesenSCG-928-A17]|nr:hypothetical protein [Bacteroidales bacterium OttesenSCG-928-A17]
MEFTYNKIESIAGCAWCCIISKEKEEINLLHGERIETFENGFVEGVWEDIFENFYFENSVFFLGSGAKINNDSI